MPEMKQMNKESRMRHYIQILTEQDSLEEA